MQLRSEVAKRNRYHRTNCLLLLLVICFALIPASHIAGSPTQSVSQTATTLKLLTQLVEFRVLEEDRSHINFGVKLKLTFVNSGDKPVILLKQNFEIVAEMLARSPEYARETRYVYTSSHFPSISIGPEWTNWRRKIDTPRPLPNEMIVLAPARSMSTYAEATIYYEKAGGWVRANRPWDEIKQLPNLCLQIEIETWPVNLEPKHDPENREFGQTLQKRWLPYGNLQLEYLRSEPVEVALPIRILAGDLQPRSQR